MSLPYHINRFPIGRISLLFALLLIPLATSLYYAQPINVEWFLWAATAGVLSVTSILFSATLVKTVLLRVLFGGLLLLILAIFQLSRFLSFYFQGGSFNQQFFFHFNLNAVIEAGMAYQSLLGVSLAFLAAVAFLSFLTLRATRYEKVTLYKSVLLLVMFSSCTAIDPDLFRLLKGTFSPLWQTEQVLAAESLPWQELGLNKSVLDKSQSAALPGKNLVFIYLESLESQYLDEQVFPGLTPHLSRIMGEGLNFTSIQQVAGTGWTVAGILSSQCGTPLLYEPGPDGNDILQNGFLDQAVCLGDVLKQAGYQQTFLGGASTRFAGKRAFLVGHGYDEVLGKDELTVRLEDSSYLSGWGLYDDSLLSIAVERYNELASSEKPFNLTLLTLDTHHPDGHSSASCTAYEKVDNSMLDAVYCSDFLLNKFVAEISKHEAWEDTVVVILSDHLAMRNVAYQYYAEDYNRQLFFTVLNADRQGEIRLPGTHMDVAPTVLDLLGVSHGQTFVAGSSLLATSRQQIDKSILISEQRQQALGFVNSTLLTSSGGELCETPQVLAVRNGRLSLAGKEYVLTISGNPVRIDKLTSDYGLLALLTPTGVISSVIVFHLASLEHVVYQFQKSPYMMLLPTSSVPGAYGQGSGTAGQVSALLGNYHGDFFPLASAQTVAQLTIEANDCAEKLASVLKGTRQLEIGMESICRDTFQTDNSFDAESGFISLEEVVVGDALYRGVIAPTGNGGYSLMDVSFVRMLVDEDRGDHCQAYYGNGELIIPSIKVAQRTDGEYLWLRLRAIPGEEGQFDVLESSNGFN